MLLKKKQICFFYGGITLTKLNSLIDKSLNNPNNLFILLETMLFMVVFRLGLAKSPFMAKFLIKKGFILLNGKEIFHKFHKVSVGDIISVNPMFWFSSFIDKVSFFKSKKSINLDSSRSDLSFMIPLLFYRLPSKNFEFNFKLMSGIMLSKPSLKNTFFPVKLEFSSLF